MTERPAPESQRGQALTEPEDNNYSKYASIGLILAKEFEIRYGISNRLDHTQKTVFRHYFGSYSLLKNKENAAFLDASQGASIEMAQRIPIIGSLVSKITDHAEKLRSASKELRTKGDNFATKYEEALKQEFESTNKDHGEDYYQFLRRKGSPRKLLLTANYLTSMMLDSKPDDITEYLDRTIPVRDELKERSNDNIDVVSEKNLKLGPLRFKYKHTRES